MKKLKRKNKTGYKVNMKKQKEIAKYRRYLAKKAAEKGVPISKLVKISVS